MSDGLHLDLEGKRAAVIGFGRSGQSALRLLHALGRSGALAGGERDAANADAYAVLRTWIARQVDAGAMRALPFPVWMALVFTPALSLTRHWVQQAPPAVAPKVRAALEHAAWMAVAP